jgi:glycine hydroxymethyltransferase
MKATAAALARELAALGLPVHQAARGGTTSHQLAIEAHRWGGGQAAAKRLRLANLLACGIGLPVGAVPGDVNGLRLGVPEIVRLGMSAEHMPTLASFIARSLVGNDAPNAIADNVTAFRRGFQSLQFIRSGAG